MNLQANDIFYPAIGGAIIALLSVIASRLYDIKKLLEDIKKNRRI